MDFEESQPLPEREETTGVHSPAEGDRNQDQDAMTTEERLMISKIVCENFKSYAGVKELGPFHKVRVSFYSLYSHVFVCAHFLEVGHMWVWLFVGNTRLSLCTKFRQ